MYQKFISIALALGVKATLSKTKCDLLTSSILKIDLIYIFDISVARASKYQHVEWSYGPLSLKPTNPRNDFWLMVIIFGVETYI